MSAAVLMAWNHNERLERKRRINKVISDASKKHADETTKRVATEYIEKHGAKMKPEVKKRLMKTFDLE